LSRPPLRRQIPRRTLRSSSSRSRLASQSPQVRQGQRGKTTTILRRVFLLPPTRAGSGIWRPAAVPGDGGRVASQKTFGFVRNRRQWPHRIEMMKRAGVLPRGLGEGGATEREEQERGDATGGGSTEMEVSAARMGGEQSTDGHGDHRHASGASTRSRSHLIAAVLYNSQPIFLSL
jgi:hypothetical protein